MIEQFTLISVIGLGLTLLIYAFKWWASINDAKAKTAKQLEEDKAQLAKDGIDAFKNNDRGGIVNFLRRLRQSK